MRRTSMLVCFWLAITGFAQASQSEDFIRQLKARIAELDAEIQRLEVPAVNDRAHEIARLWELTHKLHERARQRFYLATESPSADGLKPWEGKDLRQDLKASVEAAQALLALQPEDPPVAEVRLTIAQLHRFAGAYDDMLAALQDVIDTHPDSPQAAQALMLLGDFQFDKDQLDRAADYYARVIAKAGQLCDTLARYKLGWIHINHERWPEAMAQFETVARGPEETPCIDGLTGEPAKLQLVTEALIALTFCYTQAHPPSQALAYFERFQMPKARAVQVYEKLANRLFILEQFPAARMVYRHLVSLSDDPEAVADWNQRLEDIGRHSPAK